MDSVKAMIQELVKFADFVSDEQAQMACMDYDDEDDWDLYRAERMGRGLDDPCDQVTSRSSGGSCSNRSSSGGPD